MAEELLVTVKGVVPTPTGCGVFLGHGDKVIAIFVDHSVATAITLSMHKIKKPRPLTHDLVGSILAGLGVKLQKVVVNDLQGDTFFARLSLLQENELGRSMAEIDSRPSDAIALALQLGCPIYVRRAVWDQSEDMTRFLKRSEPGESGELPSGGESPDALS